MKLTNDHLSPDQNWQWPQKTWFRERLNALKARENEQRRKVALRSSNGTAATVQPRSDKDEFKIG